MDTILEKVCKHLGVEIDEYRQSDDPTRNNSIEEWTVPAYLVKDTEKRYAEKLKNYRELTRKRKSSIGDKIL